MVSIGDLREALNTAQTAIEHADSSRVLFVRIITRANLGYVLHQQGLIDQAAAKFAEAERLTEGKPLTEWSHGVLIQYCELLLSQGKADDVKNRLTQVLKSLNENQKPGVLGLCYLTLANSLMLDSQRSERAKAKEFINRAVYLLRHGGQTDRVIFGLLTRAARYRQDKDFDSSFHDLSEVFRIANRSGMGLHLADYHLESARLQLAKAERETASAHLVKAKEMIERMGYHRRDKEVAELEAQLA